MLSSRPLSIHNDVPYQASFKTPGRGRVAALRENAFPGGVPPSTKGKQALKTPFKQPSTSTSHPTLKTPHPTKASQPGPKLVMSTAPRPLGDKTPFTNRNHNWERQREVSEDGTPFRFPLANITLDPAPGMTPAPASVLRPSSTRRSIRRSSGRSSGSLGLGGIGGLNLTGLGLGTFETPRVNGNPWDVSDVDIIAPVFEEDGTEAEEAEDFDDFEYMPPKVAERPYEPEFAMPDYKVLGRMLRNLSHSYPLDDSPDQPWPAEDPLEEKALLDATGFVPLHESDKWETLSGPGSAEPFQFSSIPTLPAGPKSPTAAAIRPAATRPVLSTLSSRASTRAFTLARAPSTARIVGKLPASSKLLVASTSKLTAPCVPVAAGRSRGPPVSKPTAPKPISKPVTAVRPRMPTGQAPSLPPASSVVRARPMAARPVPRSTVPASGRPATLYRQTSTSRLAASSVASSRAPSSRSAPVRRGQPLTSLNEDRAANSEGQKEDVVLLFQDEVGEADDFKFAV